MYSIRLCHPITHNVVNRSFKSLKTGFSFVRSFCSSLTFEVIPIGTGESYYCFYDLVHDEFVINESYGQVSKPLDYIND